ncbi:hypothetical protein GS445_27370 [Rhodococcus hoagii]|nr:hypothetical protein [Prescottella equi]
MGSPGADADRVDGRRPIGYRVAESSDTLKIMSSDERVQAVDTCVVNLTRG